MKQSPYEPACPFCNGSHATKAAYLKCSTDRRKTFAELDAAMTKISNAKETK